jgi:ABC-type polar amino acid transport system ATPase subunit
MIEFKRVNKYYGTHHVLRNVTLTVARGEVVVVRGPSGSGKSTLIKCVNALESYQDGHILVEGIEVASRARSATHCASGLVWCSRILSSIRTLP